jgi:response regulator RpfG family c-di-GMP phosphodiesterase
VAAGRRTGEICANKSARFPCSSVLGCGLAHSTKAEVPYNEIKAIIADGDDSRVSHLESMLSDVWPDLVICGKARNGPEALELIHEHKSHLAFLEVRTPGTCGMQVARKIARVLGCLHHIP